MISGFNSIKFKFLKEKQQQLQQKAQNSRKKKQKTNIRETPKDNNPMINQKKKKSQNKLNWHQTLLFGRH